MTTVAAYVRVSSRSQNLATQRHALQQLVRPEDGEVTWYLEKRSAKTMDRPELKRVLHDVGLGRVRKLYVFKLDRLTRTGVHDTYQTVEHLKAHGCTLVTAADGLPPITPGEDLPLTAKIVLTVLALAAEIELSVKNDRISAARERHAAEGLAWGRPLKERGGGGEGSGAAKLAQVLEMRRRGLSVRQIAIAAKVPRATVAYWVSKKVGAAEPSGDPSGLA